MGRSSAGRAANGLRDAAPLVLMVSLGNTAWAAAEGGPPHHAGPPAVQEMATGHEAMGADSRFGEHATGDWLGARDALAENGVAFDAYLVADLSQNFRGGLDTEGRAFRHLFDLNVTLDTEPLFNLDGGTLYAEFVTFGGGNGTAELVGDLQFFSNIDGDDFTALYALWYQQVFAGGKLRVKVGKVDVSTEFDALEHGAEFIHSGPGASATLSAAGYPTYPDPATSVNVFFQPVDYLYVGVGVYDGAAREGVRTGTRGPATFPGEPADLFLIGEVGVNTGTGRVAAGAFRHTGTFERVDGSGATDSGANGFYFLLEQALYKENPRDAGDAQGAVFFVQFDAAEDDVIESDVHVSAGAVWTGPLPTRDDDAFGLAAHYAHLGRDARAAGTFSESYELAIEAFYKVQFTPWLSLKPDLQYVIHPGGGGLDDALVATVRLEVAF